MLESLPDDLRARTRILRESSVGDQGQAFVLYWMRTAQRGHENPAFDVAVELANEWSLPVVVAADSVFLGISSARRCAFALQGASEAGAELEKRGATFVLATERTQIEALTADARLVVCEDLPVPWHRDAIDQVTPEGATVLVDTACVVPMQAVPGVHDRAYKFRKEHSPLFADWAEHGWDEPIANHAFKGTVPEGCVEAPFDWARVAEDASFDVDLEPVEDTRGGATAGYARWRSFLDDGLDDYRKLRNDAAKPEAVSRMSAYLHYGQVSPFRVVRETREAGGDGAYKFIDELVTWRELAHHVCFHAETPPGVDWIPDWAMQTLREHEEDPRPALPSEEDLHAGATGEELWDLAQQSLVRHGELHNNLRMTWGKQLLLWTERVEDAVRLSIELNDTYALDGQDPNSYLGLLWCFGAFDRPFKPGKEVFGEVRIRTMDYHARRLDVDAYRDWVTR